MKYFQLTMLICGMLCMSATANDIYNYEAQIDVGAGWVAVPVVSTEILSQEIDDHFYGVIVIGADRVVNWMGHTPSEEVVKIGIEMPLMPSWWGSYKARFRPFSIGPWSEPSEPVMVIDLAVMPVIKAFVALPG